MIRYHNRNLTSYDLLKSLALLLMILDHVGYFFYPGNEWFRIAGRASLPIWMFLIGYARSRDLSKPLWAGAGVLILASFILGGPVFPLNILVTIIIARLLIDFLATIIFPNWERAAYGAFLLAIFMLCTYQLFEYGTAALLIALAGYLARQRSTGLSETARKGFMAFSIIFYAFTQLLIFKSFGKAQAEAMVVLIGLVSMILYSFRPDEMTETQNRLPGFVVSALQFGGRYTLEIYVFHLILFKSVLCVKAIAPYGWFHWTLAG